MGHRPTPSFKPATRAGNEPAETLLARWNESLERLRRRTQPRVLHITHGFGGGIAKHVDDLTAQANTVDSFILQPTGSRREVRLHWTRDPSDSALFFRLPIELPLLRHWIRELEIGLIHFHHVIGIHEGIWDLAELVPERFFTFHDFYTACPRVHLLDSQGRYCALPAPATCRTCLSQSAQVSSRDIAAWRDRHQRRLQTMTRWLAPSPAIATLARKAFPDLAIEVHPHPEPDLVPSPTAPGDAATEPPTTLHVRPLRIAILGTLDEKKGRDVVLATAERLQRELRAENSGDASSEPPLAIEFHLIGKLHYFESETELRRRQQRWLRDLAASAASARFRWIDHGAYATETELRTKLRANRIQLVWISSLIPETYSYTLSAALQTGCWVICHDCGAQADRVRNLRRGFCAPPEWRAEAWASWLRQCLRVTPAAFDPDQCVPLGNEPAHFYRTCYARAPAPVIAPPAAEGSTPPFFSEDSIHPFASPYHLSRQPWPARVRHRVRETALLRMAKRLLGPTLRNLRRGLR